MSSAELFHVSEFIARLATEIYSRAALLYRRVVIAFLTMTAATGCNEFAGLNEGKGALSVPVGASVQLDFGALDPGAVARKEVILTGDIKDASNLSLQSNCTCLAMLVLGSPKKSENRVRIEFLMAHSKDDEPSKLDRSLQIPFSVIGSSNVVLSGAESVVLKGD